MHDGVGRRVVPLRRAAPRSSLAPAVPTLISCSSEKHPERTRRGAVRWAGNRVKRERFLMSGCTRNALPGSRRPGRRSCRRAERSAVKPYLLMEITGVGRPVFDIIEQALVGGQLPVRRDVHGRDARADAPRLAGHRYTEGAARLSPSGALQTRRVRMPESDQTRALAEEPDVRGLRFRRREARGRSVRDGSARRHGDGSRARVSVRPDRPAGDRLGCVVVTARPIGNSDANRRSPPPSTQEP
jgi:hypothetical protein